MNTRFLLDTNIVSDLVRNPQRRAAAMIASTGEAAVATSLIVAAELRYGAAKKAGVSSIEGDGLKRRAALPAPPVGLRPPSVAGSAETAAHIKQDKAAQGGGLLRAD